MRICIKLTAARIGGCWRFRCVEQGCVGRHRCGGGERFRWRLCGGRWTRSLDAAPPWCDGRLRPRPARGQADAGRLAFLRRVARAGPGTKSGRDIRAYLERARGLLGGLEERLFGGLDQRIRTVVALSAEIVVVDGPEHDSSQALGSDVTSLNNEALVNLIAFVPTPV